MSLTGTSLLLRQDLRRDRVIVPAWVAILVVMTYASASATQTLFRSVEERVSIATSLNEQPGLLALYGPIRDPHSAGELAMSKLTVLYALLSAILYVVLVRRHTRVEEETGRAELAAGTAIGGGLAGCTSFSRLACSLSRKCCGAGATSVPDSSPRDPVLLQVGSAGLGASHSACTARRWSCGRWAWRSWVCCSGQ